MHCNAVIINLRVASPFPRESRGTKAPVVSSPYILVQQLIIRRQGSVNSMGDLNAGWNSSAERWDTQAALLEPAGLSAPLAYRTLHQFRYSVGDRQSAW